VQGRSTLEPERAALGPALVAYVGALQLPDIPVLPKLLECCCLDSLLSLAHGMMAPSGALTWPDQHHVKCQTIRSA